MAAERGRDARRRRASAFVVDLVHFDLARDEELVARDTRVADGQSYRLVVAVDLCRVQVAVAHL